MDYFSRIFDLLIEGLSTGGSVFKTGARVGRFRATAKGKALTRQAIDNNDSGKNPRNIFDRIKRIRTKMSQRDKSLHSDDMVNATSDITPARTELAKSKEFEVGQMAGHTAELKRRAARAKSFKSTNKSNGKED